MRPPEPVQWNGTPTGFRECLRGAGFAVPEAGEPTGIPRQADGWLWDESVVFGVLDDWMTWAAQARLDAPAWQAHLLMLGRPVKKGLYGVMFDIGGGLPRQGCAVFADEIRARTDPADHDRRIIQTVVHELGHTCNLVHRFERPVGRADSTSFMNYDWMYDGGNQAALFWDRFAYRFDDDELAFLRHGPRTSVEPGTAPFHSADYWGAAPGTNPAFIPAAPTPGFRLTLEPPARGAVFEFGQPIYLQVTLGNTGPAAVPLPPGALDIKAGHLEIIVERGPGDGSGTIGADARSFVPMVQRCLIDFTGDDDQLEPGDSITENVSLTFGAGGFPMAEPGTYLLTPLLSLPGDNVIRGRTLRVRVAYPRSRRDEDHAAVLQRPDVGAWFALGGSEVLGAARDSLSAIREERMATAGPADPIAATITRSLGLDASRPYVRFTDGKYSSHPADTDRAFATLGALTSDETAMLCFDEATAEKTRDLFTLVRSGDIFRVQR
ncbi:zinc metalloprotease [Paractinoplanes durhamensis]|uniref:hypothetical protein n=1 Tax=Paractinoplanes durhamensis TaxID=113563 RepID=UPI0036442959